MSTRPSARLIQLISWDIANCRIVELSACRKVGDGSFSGESSHLARPAAWVWGPGLISDRTWPHQKQQSRCRWPWPAATGQFSVARCSGTQPPSRLLWLARGRGTDASDLGGVAPNQLNTSENQRGHAGCHWRASHPHRVRECVKEAHEVRRRRGLWGCGNGHRNEMRLIQSSICLVSKRLALVFALCTARESGVLL